MDHDMYTLLFALVWIGPSDVVGIARLECCSDVRATSASLKNNRHPDGRMLNVLMTIVLGWGSSEGVVRFSQTVDFSRFNLSNEVKALWLLSNQSCGTWNDVLA